MFCKLQSAIGHEKNIGIPAANWYMNGKGLSEDMTAEICKDYKQLSTEYI
jgi:hypothetical protein